MTLSQNLQKFVKFQKFQLDNLVDFEKCCKTHIFLQKSVPIQPKTSNILPKFCQNLATTLRVVAGSTPTRARVLAAQHLAGPPAALASSAEGRLGLTKLGNNYL